MGLLQRAFLIDMYVRREQLQPTDVFSPLLAGTQSFYFYF